MKLNRLFSAFVAVFLALGATAQTVKVEFYTPTTVRVTKTPTDAPVEKNSLVVISKPENVKVKKSVVNRTEIYRSSALTVVVSPDGKVSFETPNGDAIMNEGECAFTPITSGIDKGSYKVKQGFALDQDEPIYGVGMLQNGKMNLRGEHRRMEQSNLEDYAHFFQSVKGYGIYWDNYSPTRIDDNATLELESEVGNLVDYYFMYGGNADGVIRLMRQLTGKVPMVPRWTYGFHQSRERYKSQDELLEVVHKYRDLKIPFDGIIQDWQYWGSNYTWNAMDFLNDAFGNPQRMIDDVHKNNAHISISIWASFGPNTLQFKELKDKDLLFSFETWPQSGLSFWPPRMDYPSGVRVYDCYSPEARDIYWKYLSKMHKMGIDAWWMDSTDPDHHSYKDSDLDEKCSMGSYRSVRNLFPFMTVGGVDEHQRAVDNDKRVFILTRSFFAGQQRYGSMSWSGDVGSNWDSFRKQIPLCLNHTMCANPNVNTDLGGFFANSYNRCSQDNSATKNPQYQELYVRWMQFGIFSPMMRSHGTEVYRELYHYGQAGEPVYDALVDAVKMRYQLMPYIYSTSYQVSKNDDSFMRALVMDFKDDKQTWDLGKEYMFGRSLLVCPVVDPLFTQEKIFKTNAMSGWDKKDNDEYKNGWPVVDWSQKKSYEVYLPAGASWYDYWTGELLDGGQKVKADAPLAHCPLYVKAGSILPLGEDIQYADEQKENMTLNVYPGKNASFTLYEDEGDNYNYKKGICSTISLTWNDASRTLTIGKRTGEFPGMLKTRTFTVKTPSGAAKTVKYIGQKISVKF